MNIHPLMIARAAVVVAALGPSWAATAQDGPSIVGEATMVIGMARLIAADGTARAVDRGAAIREGDRIETEAGGHVHLRFVDGGRLSVRPASRLQIENYSHSRQQPQLSAIKFRLDEGVVRSITGSWGEAARDRFRLNTPVAAIGVKGTDFVVRSVADTTAAAVYTGAILVTPLANGCVASLGPCLNGKEQLLSEDMKGVMLELSRQEPVPRLVPVVDLMAKAQADKPATTDTARSDASADKSIANEARAAGVVSVPQVTELVWGRYAWAKPLENDSFSRQFELAMLNGRENVVGTGTYGLLRDASPAGAVLASADPVVNFRLASGAAGLVYENGRIDPVKIDAAMLNVDFSRSTFTTQLNVSGTALGNDIVKADGAISASGVMQVTNANAFVLGGFTLNGKEAGYSFDKTVPLGHLQGLTLWGR